MGSQWGIEAREYKPTVNSASNQIWNQLGSWMIDRMDLVTKAQELLNSGHYSYGLTPGEVQELQTKVIQEATKIRNTPSEYWPYPIKRGGKKTRKGKRHQKKRKQTRRR